MASHYLFGATPVSEWHGGGATILSSLRRQDAEVVRASVDCTRKYINISICGHANQLSKYHSVNGIIHTIFLGQRSSPSGAAAVAMILSSLCRQVAEVVRASVVLVNTSTSPHVVMTFANFCLSLPPHSMAAVAASGAHHVP